jgi:hypothetical protein
MDLRNSFLKPFKKAKQRIKGGRLKRDRGSESKNDRGGKEADAEGSEVSQRNSRLHSEAEDVVESGPSREGKDVDEKEVGQIDPSSTLLIPRSEEPNGMQTILSRWLLPLIVSLENVDTPTTPVHIQEAPSSDRSELKQEVNPVHPSPTPSTPSVSYSAEFDGAMLSTLSQPLPVTISSSNTDNPSALDHVQEPTKSSIHALGPGAAFEDTSSRNSAASTTPNTIFRRAGESLNAYLLLKSVARCLCLILDNCEVRYPSCTFDPQSSQLY